MSGHVQGMGSKYLENAEESPLPIWNFVIIQPCRKMFLGLGEGALVNTLEWILLHPTKMYAEFLGTV